MEMHTCEKLLTCDLDHLEVQLNLLNWLYSGALIVFDPGHKHFYGHHIRDCILSLEPGKLG